MPSKKKKRKQIKDEKIEPKSQKSKGIEKEYKDRENHNNCEKKWE